MQFWTDYLKISISKGYIIKEDLYKMSEFEIIEKIKEKADKEMLYILEKFQNTTEIGRSNTEIKDKYCVSIKAKKRYINPLVNTKRISEISNKANKIIDNIKAFEDSKFAYLDFEF